MREVKYRPSAMAQLEQISDQTIAEWGEVQAKAYVQNIRRQIAMAAEFPGIGSSAHGLSPDYRKVRAGVHRVIYRHSETELIVVRIIHERQDVAGELDEV